MTDRHSIRNGIIATVVGGVILAALGRLWPPASHVLTGIGQVLITLVPVPVWLLLLLGASLVALTVTSLRRHVRAESASSSDRLNSGPSGAPPTASPDLANDLSQFERQILARLAKADGEAVPRDTLKRSLGATNLRVQAAVDRLVHAELVEELESVDDPDDIVVVLTSKGRQYAVQHGLA